MFVSRAQHKYKRRFYPLLMEEGEYMFEDFSALLRLPPPPNSTAQQFIPLADRKPIPGRLFVCSKNVVFDPEDARHPLYRLPFSGVASIKARKGEKEQELCLIQVTSATEIVLHAAYTTRKFPAGAPTGEFAFEFPYTPLAQFVGLLAELQSVSRLPSPHERNKALRRMIDAREKALRFDPSWIRDIREKNVLSPYFPLLQAGPSSASSPQSVLSAPPSPRGKGKESVVQTLTRSFGPEPGMRLPPSASLTVSSTSFGDQQMAGEELLLRHENGEHLPSSSPTAHNALGLHCFQVEPLVLTPGCLVLTDQRIYFQAYNTVLVEPVEAYELSLVARVYKRRHQMRDVGLEVFFRSSNATFSSPNHSPASHSSAFNPFSSSSPSSSSSSSPDWNSADKQVSAYFSFGTVAERDLVYKAMLEQPIVQLDQSHTLNEMIRLWLERKVSTYEYLVFLNQQAGRSYMDLSQYPVFPWLIADYSSATLDLNNPATYRDLSKPIGALNTARLQHLRKRMQEMPENAPGGRFLYGTHYSTPGYVLYFLVRSVPQYQLCLQQGRFDLPDRLFRSIRSSWESVLTSQSDVKELIPEFYAYEPTPPARSRARQTRRPEEDSDSESEESEEEGGGQGEIDFLVNEKMLDLGCTSRGLEVDDVELPPWARGSPRLFLKLCRAALESDFTSQHVHQWLDLLFGCLQRGQAAAEADNLFYWLTYEGAVDLDSIEDEVERESLRIQINEFGQTPKQIFFRPHPRRDAVLSREEIQTLCTPPKPPAPVSAPAEAPGLEAMLSDVDGKVGGDVLFPDDEMPDPLPADGKAQSVGRSRSVSPRTLANGPQSAPRLASNASSRKGSNAASDMSRKGSNATLDSRKASNAENYGRKGSTAENGEGGAGLAIDPSMFRHNSFNNNSQTTTARSALSSPAAALAAAKSLASSAFSSFGVASTGPPASPFKSHSSSSTARKPNAQSTATKKQPALSSADHKSEASSKTSTSEAPAAAQAQQAELLPTTALPEPVSPGDFKALNPDPEADTYTEAASSGVVDVDALRAEVSAFSEDILPTDRDRNRPARGTSPGRGGGGPARARRRQRPGQTSRAGPVARGENSNGTTILQEQQVMAMAQPDRTEAAVAAVVAEEQDEGGQALLAGAAAVLGSERGAAAGQVALSSWIVHPFHAAHTDVATGVAVSNDGKQVCSVARNSELRVHSIPDYKLRRQAKLSELQLSSCAFSSDRMAVAVGSWDNDIYLYSIAQGAARCQVAAHDDAVSTLSLQGEHLLSGSWDTSLKLWSCTSGRVASRPLLDLVEHEAQVTCCMLGPEGSASGGQLALSGDQSGAVILWDTRQAGCVRAHSVGNQVSGVLFGAEAGDARALSGLVCSTRDGQLRLYELRATRATAKVRTDHPITCLSWDPQPHLPSPPASPITPGPPHALEVRPGRPSFGTVWAGGVTGEISAWTAGDLARVWQGRVAPEGKAGGGVSAIAALPDGGGVVVTLARATSNVLLFGPGPSI
eukprot:g36712.t1